MKSICVQFGLAVGFAFGVLAAMFFYNAFVIPSDVNYEVRKVYVEAAERGLGYYSLNQSNGEIEFNWKAPCTDGPERVE